MHKAAGDLFIGIDLGTTGVVAGVFDAQGNTRGLAEVPYDTEIRGPGPAAVIEQDPARWWEATCAALRAVIAGGDPERLAAICAGGQGPSLVAIDEHGDSVARSPIWMDTRSEPVAIRLAQRSGSAGMGLTLIAKALWLEEHSPECAARVAYYLQSWDYLAMQLCGVPFTSSPWDDAAIAASGLPAGRFPPYRACPSIVGALSQRASAATGLPAGLPVVSGTNDSMMGLIGCGATARGRGCALGGTSGGFAVAWEKTPGVWRPPHGTYPEPPGLQYFGEATAASGRILNWCLATLGYPPTTQPDEWAAAASSVPPGSAGLLLLPYLAGERAPFHDPLARGVFFGLGLHHTPAHLIRASLEGVALSVRHVMEATIQQGAQVYDVRVLGGQAQSELWNQIKADVLNRPVLVPTVIQAGALGGAIVAAAGVGTYGSIWDGAQAMVHLATRLEPDPAAASLYERSFAIYRDLYPRLRDLFPMLHGLS